MPMSKLIYQNWPPISATSMSATAIGISPPRLSFCSWPRFVCNAARKEENENPLHILRTVTSLLHGLSDARARCQPAHHRELSGHVPLGHRLCSEVLEEAANQSG